jgi:hypothetical protein
MIHPAWSWLLTGTTCTALLLAGTAGRRRLGWGLALGGEALWAIYAVTTEQYGFLVGAVAFAAVYARNLWRDGRRP